MERNPYPWYFLFWVAFIVIHLAGVLIARILQTKKELFQRIVKWKEEQRV